MLTNNTELVIATFRLKYQVNAGSHALGDNKNKYCINNNHSGLSHCLQLDHTVSPDTKGR